MTPPDNRSDGGVIRNFGYTRTSGNLRGDRRVSRVGFFGYEVDVHLDRVDEAPLEFFFRHQIVPRQPEQPDFEVAVGAPDVGFFGSLLAKDQREKCWRIRDCRAGSERSGSFTRWSSLPAILPPFLADRLASRVIVLPGAVLRRPDGVTVLIRGQNHTGKTSITIELLGHGWHLIADHLVVMDSQSGFIHQYLSPIGLRQETLAKYRTRASGLPHFTTISQETGPVVLLHAEDLVPESVLGEQHYPPVGVVLNLGSNPSEISVLTRRPAESSIPAFWRKAGVRPSTWLPSEAWDLNLARARSYETAAAAVLGM